MVHEGQGQAQPLLHAQGEVLEGLFPCGGQIHLLQHLVHHPPAGNAPLEAVVLQVLPRRQVGVEARGLHHGPGAGAGPGQGLLPRLAEQGELPLGGGRLGRHHPDDGGLARPVAAHQAVNLPLGNGQVGVIHRQVVPVPLGQPLGR